MEKKFFDGEFEVATFKKSNRKNAKQGYIKRMPNGTYFVYGPCKGMGDFDSHDFTDVRIAYSNLCSRGYKVLFDVK